MITSADAFKRFGDPKVEKGMVLTKIPDNLQFGPVPEHVYCNQALVYPLMQALNNIVDRKLTAQVQTWDGCFCIRSKRGALSRSLHSWGLAIDINAATNVFGNKPTMPLTLVKCFTDAGFDWGGRWQKPDGMHFQLSKFTS